MNETTPIYSFECKLLFLSESVGGSKPTELGWLGMLGGLSLDVNSLTGNLPWQAIDRPEFILQ